MDIQNIYRIWIRS